MGWLALAVGEGTDHHALERQGLNAADDEFHQ
jgi:hypothetical protein